MRVLLFAILLFTLSACSHEKRQRRDVPIWPTDITSTQAWANHKSVWENFRTSFPYHLQIVGVQEFSDNSCVILMSEPAAHVSLEALQQFFAFYNSKLTVLQHAVGHDGWTKDAVAAVSDVTAGQRQDLIRKLNQFLFQSAYKADLYLPLPLTEERPAFIGSNVNYQVSTAELYQWFLADQEALVPLEQPTANGTTLAAILNQGANGVYLSREPGFVVWVMRRGGDLANEQNAIRQFALDADLILGALASGQNLAIIGRERENKIHELPPLRTETVLQLAAAQQEELAQSYERLTFMAGKMPGGKDWAPIFLSDELLNTEYGSLLNLTDQMLKSWSCNGQIDYAEFPHPKPGKWVFNKGGVGEELGVNTITFNWNTKGAAYAIPEAGFEIIALNRTGSLPISYIPEGMEDQVPTTQMEKAEEKGYGFFSRLNNPDLVRVVQYAALYQIFRNYDITSSGKANNGSKLQANPLVDTYAKALQALDGMSDADARAVSNRMAEAHLQSLVKTDEEAAEILQGSPEYTSIFLQEVRQDIITQLDGLRGMLDNLRSTTGSIQSVALLLAQPRDGGYESEMQARNAGKLQQYAFGLSLYGIYDQLGYHLDKVCEKYVSAHAASESYWIKTPSVVISWQRDSVLATGGHNLNSHIVKFQVDDALRAGEFRVSEVGGKRLVYVAESDLGRITPQMLRAVEDAPVNRLVQLGSRMPKVNQAPRARANVVSPAARPVRGLSQDAHIGIRRLASGGFECNGKRLATYEEFTQECQLLLAENRGKNIAFKLESFSPDEARLIVKNAEVKAAFREGLVQPGNLFDDVSGKHFDFSKATVEAFPNEGRVMVNIPARSKWGAMKINLTRLSKQLVKKVQAIIERVVKRCKRKPELNFEQELRLELNKANINPDEILFLKEFEDVIYGAVPLPPGKNKIMLPEPDSPERLS